MALVAVQEAHARASDARALAVWHARRAGVTSRRLGELLGMAHKNVLMLERRGGELVDAVGAIPPRRIADVDVAPEPVGPVCIRAGCPLPAGEGGRFCAGHRWS